MNINHAIIHQINTDAIFSVGIEQARNVELKLTETEHSLEDDSQLLILAKLLEDRIKSSGKGSSKFNNPEKQVSSTGHFNKYLKGDESFVEFTQGLSEILVAKIPETATGGYLTFIDYTLENRRLIFICILKLEEGVTIDTSKMEVTDATTIQSKNIHEGARLDTASYLDHINGTETPENYIDWIKTKKSEKLSNYFQELLEIDIEIDNRAQTTLFKKAVDHYIDGVSDACEDSVVESFPDFTKENLKHELKSKVYEMIGSRASTSSSVDFNEVDDLLRIGLSKYEIEPAQKFTTYASEKFSDLSNLFKPFEKQTNTWGIVNHVISNEHNQKIKFSVDRAISRNADFFEYNKQERTVTIKKVGKEFFDRIG